MSLKMIAHESRANICTEKYLETRRNSKNSSREEFSQWFVLIKPEKFRRDADFETRLSHTRL